MIVNSLIAIGDIVSDQEHINAIVDGLPEEYNSFVLMIYSRLDSPSIEEVESILMMQEAQFEKYRQELTNPSVSANLAQSELPSKPGNSESQEVGTEYYNAGRGRGRGHGRGRGRGRSNSNRLQCQICAGNNHDAARCWFRYDQASSSQAHHKAPPFNSHMRPMANFAMQGFQAPPSEYAASSSYSEAPWYPDSAASHHLTFNPHNLAYRTPYNGQEQVFMGNGQGVSIQSFGYSSFTAPFNSNVKLSLNDLLHVPNISKNLLSVSKFAQDNNVIFEFHPYKCFVKSQDSKQILLEGVVGSDGLYQFKPLQFLPSMSKSLSYCNNTTISSVLCNSSSSSNDSFNKCHCRLGHANPNVVKSILNLCKIPFQNKHVLDFCVACSVGKSHKLHAPLSNTTYTKPFEVVHCDLWGPSPFTSHYGYNYYISFVDTFTKYTWIYFLKNKSDTIQAFKLFYQLIQNQL